MMNFLWLWMRKTLLFHRRVSLVFDTPTENQHFFHCYPCTHKGYLQTEVQLCPAAQMSPKQSMPADVRGTQHCYHMCFSSLDSFSLIIFSRLLLSPQSSSGRLLPCPSSAGTGEISFESMAIQMRG